MLTTIVLLVLALCFVPIITAQAGIQSDTVCQNCGMPIGNATSDGVTSKLAASLGMELCMKCWLSAFYGSVESVALPNIARLGEDGKVLPEQLPAGQGGAAWGDITGTLAAQTDLQGALNAKESAGAVGTHESLYNHANIHSHSNITILSATQEALTTALKTSYDWLVTNITSLWKTAVDNHIASTSNPHSVTNAQVGLANVTNDAQIAKSLVDAKGDVVAATADNTPARLGVGSDGQVLSVDSTQPTGLKWSTPTSGGESEAVVVLTSDRTNATTSFADITDLTFTPLGGKTYIIEAWLVFQSNTAGCGIKFSANGPASPTAYVMNAQVPIGLTLYASDSNMASRAYNTGTASASVDAINSNLLATIDCVLVNGANSSPFTLRFGAETTGTVKVLAGSTLRYRQVN